MLRQLALWLALLSRTISGHAVRAVSGNNTAPALPSEDAFYRVPDDLDSYAPGAIIRHRQPPSPIAAQGTRRLRLDASHQLLYRTTDSLNKATATVLTVLVPRNANLDRVLSYQAVIDAASIDCAPSYAYQLHAAAAGGTRTTQSEVLLVEAALEQGWVVIVPDYLGPRGAFLANVLSGRAVLDGIRAAKSSRAITRIGRAPTVALWGYSGGSLATLSAAELQPSYAPELVLAGAAAGGAVPNMTTVLARVNGTPAAGLIPAGVLGLANQYPEVAGLVRRHLLPQYREAFYKAATQCLDADVRQFSGQDVVGMVDDPAVLLASPVVRGVAAANDLGRHAPATPVFLYKAVGDEISPVAETDALAASYCATTAPATRRWLFSAPPGRSRGCSGA